MATADLVNDQLPEEERVCDECVKGRVSFGFSSILSDRLVVPRSHVTVLSREGIACFTLTSFPTRKKDIEKETGILRHQSFPSLPFLSSQIPVFFSFPTRTHFSCACVSLSFSIRSLQLIASCLYIHPLSRLG